MTQHMHREKFLSLPVDQLAKIVRAEKSIVCAFPFNGTRRWFALEHGRDFNKEDGARAYMELTTQAYIATYKLLFDHGMDTILAPVFTASAANRGEQYMSQIGSTSMLLLATHSAFVNFYEEYDVRVHFYGDYRKHLQQSPYAAICDSFDEVTRKTAGHTKHRLFYGVYPEDATETIAELSIAFYQATGKIPSRQNLIESYYGEYIEKTDMFIGFEKSAAFNYPMLSLGREKLYFTLAPSLYMTERQLRNILYDYLYLRPIQEPDYFAMPAQDFELMDAYYEANHEATFGVGEVRGGIWYPTPNTGGE